MYLSPIRMGFQPPTKKTLSYGARALYVLTQRGHTLCCGRQSRARQVGIAVRGVQLTMHNKRIRVDLNYLEILVLSGWQRLKHDVVKPAKGLGVQSKRVRSQ